MFDSVETELDPLPSSPQVWTGNYSGIEVAGSRVNGNEHLSAVSRYQVTWLKVTADNRVWVQDKGSSEQDGGNKTDATMLITSIDIKGFGIAYRLKYSLKILTLSRLISFTLSFF